MELKYIEIVEDNYETDIKGYIYPCDETVTSDLLNRLYGCISEMEYFSLSLEDSDAEIVRIMDRKTVDLLTSVNKYLGYKRFMLMEHVLTPQILEEFLDHTTKPDELNYKWAYGNISFDVENMKEGEEEEEFEKS